MQHIPYELLKAIYEEQLDRAQRERLASSVRRINRSRSSWWNGLSVMVRALRPDESTAPTCVPCPNPSS
ncbi:MAG TPA: hypothetical protein VJ482_13630 [Acidimicrobiia bacterium]|nr:hypothetical protein [Acidimicrobiia bacterium]